MKNFLFLVIFAINFYVNADYVVKTSSGIMDGYKKNGIVYWDDIPYAQPPVGDLRWKAPRSYNDPEAKISQRKQLLYSKNIFIRRIITVFRRFNFWN